MIYISYALLGAVLSAILLTLIMVVAYLKDVPTIPKAVAVVSLILTIVGVWIWVNGEWDLWTEYYDVCYPDSGLVDSPECDELKEKVSL